MSAETDARVLELMPALRAELEQLVRIPSVSSPGEVGPDAARAHDMVAELFAGAGVEVGRLDLPDTAPVVVGHIPAPAGAPTVLLYSHYDVVGRATRTSGIRRRLSRPSATARCSVAARRTRSRT